MDKQAVTWITGESEQIQAGLFVQKSVPVPRIRQWTLVEFSEHAIAVPRNQVINSVPDETRQKTSNLSHGFPEPAKPVQYHDRRIGTRP
jgi:hypothetical protein